MLLSATLMQNTVCTCKGVLFSFSRFRCSLHQQHTFPANIMNYICMGTYLCKLARFSSSKGIGNVANARAGTAWTLEAISSALVPPAHKHREAERSRLQADLYSALVPPAGQ